jgi:chorismate-pyruvate lyase
MNAMHGYFKTKGYVPGGIVKNSKQESFDIEALPPFLRVLLVTDGTVTKSLESFFWEPVVVEALGQHQQVLEQPVPWLGMGAGDRALVRRVRLKGTQSGHVYAYAESVIRLELLPQLLRDDLLAGKIGIGELLRETGLETYREIMDMGREVDPSLSSVFDAKHGDELVYRTYRILINHQPTIVITEKFPYLLYAR